MEDLCLCLAIYVELSLKKKKSRSFKKICGQIELKGKFVSVQKKLKLIPMGSSKNPWTHMLLEKCMDFKILVSSFKSILVHFPQNF